MTLDSIVPDPLRQSGTRPTGLDERGAGGARVRPTGPVPATDRIEISDEARTLAAREDADADLTAEQIAAIRRRLADGSYDTPEVLDEVARRILERGDLPS